MTEADWIGQHITKILDRQRLIEASQRLNASSELDISDIYYSMKKNLFFAITLTACMATGHAFGQDKNAAFNKMLSFSGPGRGHEALGRLAGTWAFQDAKLAFVKGTLTRKPMYEGRFYTVEITGGKLMIPVANGQMKEANYQGTQIEGFDNVKAVYTTVSVNNHIGSDIQMESGKFDTVSATFTYERDSELIPGSPVKNRILFFFCVV